MSKYLCELPWLTACGVCLILGLLLIAGSILDDDADKSPGCLGIVLTIFAVVGGTAWAILRFTA